MFPIFKSMRLTIIVLLKRAHIRPAKHVVVYLLPWDSEPRGSPRYQWVTRCTSRKALEPSSSVMMTMLSEQIGLYRGALCKQSYVHLGRYHALDHGLYLERVHVRERWEVMSKFQLKEKNGMESWQT